MTKAKQQPSPEASTIKAGGREIRVWNGGLWRRVRALDNIPDNFIENAFSYGSFAAGGGKGGDLMTTTKDNRYIVKELNKGDHASLLEVAEPYVEYVTSNTSLLSRFYLHYQDIESQRKFVVMQNLLSYSGEFREKYDLKGCADDKSLTLDGQKVHAIHKRCWHLHMWCGKCAWSPDRKRYYAGKKHAYKLAIRVTVAQKEALERATKHDVQWLTANNLMDYSFIVGFRDLSEKQLQQDADLQKTLRAPPEALEQPLMHKVKDGDGACLVYIGIIDFLQKWGCGKSCAQCIKVAERNKATIPPGPYGARFVRHFSERFLAEGELPAAVPSIEPAPVQEVMRDTAAPPKSTPESEVGSSVSSTHAPTPPPYAPAVAGGENAEDAGGSASQRRASWRSSYDGEDDIQTLKVVAEQPNKTTPSEESSSRRVSDAAKSDSAPRRVSGGAGPSNLEIKALHDESEEPLPLEAGSRAQADLINADKITLDEPALEQTKRGIKVDDVTRPPSGGLQSLFCSCSAAKKC